MHRELLIKLLGLDEKASDEAISNAANTFQSDMVAFKTNLESENERLSNAAAEAEARATKAEEAANVIANDNKTLTEELVNRDLETYKDVIVNSDEVKAQLLNNRSGTIALLKNIKVSPDKRDKEPLHNSKTAAVPEPLEKTAEKYSAEDAARISNRAREINRTTKLGYQQSFLMAQREVAQAAK